MTSEDGTRALERPFLVLATQNPIEYEGTYPLPERSSTAFCCGSVWAIRTARRSSSCSRPTRTRPGRGRARAIIDREELAMQRAVEQVHADAAILEYAVDLVTATRGAGRVEPSRHARAAQARAGEGGAGRPRLRDPR